MKKVALVFVFALIIQAIGYSQPCLPNGITFTTQAQIDNFQVNNPGCTEIEGDVIITDTYDADITNLNGLSVLTSIMGDLYIYENSLLTNLTGLNNLTFIGGVLNIQQNYYLTDLSALSSQDSGSISELWIHDNYTLTNCEAQMICDYLNSPVGSINIYNNAIGCNNPGEVANDCGFNLPCMPYGNYYFWYQYEIDNFQSLYPDCYVLKGNTNIGSYWMVYNITNLNGLSILDSIEGSISITHTHALVNLSGLDNITSIGGSLVIENNSALNYLTGLDNLTSIGGSCDIRFNSSLSNLLPLSNLMSIGNRFLLDYCPIANLSGLDNVTFIGGDVLIGYSSALSNLSGIDNLINIGGKLTIFHTTSLISIAGLENLTSIGGELSIFKNDALTSLTGLDNIEASSIDSLHIYNNNSLTECAILSICDYLASPGGTIEIHDNATGCNSQQEVEEACESVDIYENVQDIRISIFPNPATDILHISSNNESLIETVIIYNQLGQKVLHRNEIIENIDISTLGQGIYIIELNSSGFKIWKKLIIEE